jgi:hypothetical protein
MLTWTAASSKAQALRRRTPHFVSPSAQSIEIDVAQSGQPAKPITKIVDRPKHSTSSVVTFDVPAGNDTFTFGVFDRANAAGNDIGGGVTTKAIVAGRTNAVSATLDGYVAAAELTPSTGTELLKPNAKTGGYTLLGELPVEVSFTFKDADGNVILPTKQSTIAVSITSNQPSLVATHTVAGKLNTVAIQAVEPNPAFTPVTLDLQVRSGANGAQQYSQEYALQQEALLYAAAAGSPGSITVFDQEGKTYPAAGGFPGLRNPIAMTWDDRDGELFVADGTQHTILGYDGTGHSLQRWTAPSVPGITSLTYNHDTHRVYATAAQSAGAAHDAVLSFDLHGHSVVTHGFANAVGPVSIAYSNFATMNNPTGADQFWLLTTYPGGTATVRCYTTNGAQATLIVNSQHVYSETVTGSGFVPSALTAYPPAWTLFNNNSVGGTGGSGFLLAGTYNGAGSLFIGTTPPTGAGLNQPRVAVQNPLYSWWPSLNIYNQPQEFYVVNGSGGLDVIGNAAPAIGNPFQQITSVSFPPPTGATGFSALVATF